MSPRPLRIGIDAHILGKNKGGVETVVRNLIYALAAVDRENEYFLYTGERHALDTTRLPDSFHLSPLLSSNPWLERLAILPYLYRRDRLDLLHLQRATPLWGCPRTVVHIQDVEHKTNPELFRGASFRLKSFFFKRSAQGCTRIVTGSAASRQEIEYYYAISADKIDVIPHGVDGSSFFVDPPAAGEPPFLLFVGALERNKNVDGLLRAFASVRRRVPRLRLVITGAVRHETRGGYLDELHRLCDELGLASDVTFTGYVPLDTLRRLMSSARAVVFPSLAEGFGLPPLEAMACGAPVVGSSIPAIVEVCGDAALLVPPGDDEAIAAAVTHILLDDGLRASLIERGLRRSAAFNWHDAAVKLVQTYRHAANPGGDEQ